MRYLAWLLDREAGLATTTTFRLLGSCTEEVAVRSCLHVGTPSGADKVNLVAVPSVTRGRIATPSVGDSGNLVLGTGLVRLNDDVEEEADAGGDVDVDAELL